MADKLVKKGVKMLGLYILMQRDKPQEKKTPGGLFVPTSAQSQTPTWGTVLGVGPDVDKSITVGSRILVSKYAGSDVQVDDDLAVVVRSEDVYGVEQQDG